MRSVWLASGRSVPGGQSTDNGSFEIAASKAHGLKILFEQGGEDHDHGDPSEGGNGVKQFDHSHHHASPYLRLAKTNQNL